jgi:hypothetical protein
MGMTDMPYWKIFGDTTNLQQPYDVAVVMPSIGRPELTRALSSIFEQTLNRIQVMVGIDKPQGDLTFVEEFLQGCPSNVTVNLIYPGYSTSVRHGGLTLAKDGGALRAVLTQMANSNYVAYLDDDNWWGRTHLSDLLGVIKDKAWAFSLRYFVHPASKKTICVDEWESVGPAKGLFADSFGGFVDPNCLMIDKEKCRQCISWWNVPLAGDPKGMSADRNVFHCLNKHSPPGATGKASAFYVLDPNDGLHALRVKLIGSRYALVQ